MQPSATEMGASMAVVYRRMPLAQPPVLPHHKHCGLAYQSRAVQAVPPNGFRQVQCAAQGKKSDMERYTLHVCQGGASLVGF